METTVFVMLVVLLIALLAVCGYLLRQQRAHYESLLADVRADNLDLRGRMFASKGQAPPGVDLKEQYVQKQVEKAERREGGGVERAEPIDALQKARLNLVKNERRRNASK